MSQEHRQSKIRAEAKIKQLPLKEDRQFIYQQLARRPSSKWEGIFDGYIKEWLAGKEETDVSYKKSNKGRYRANQWLINLK